MLFRDEQGRQIWIDDDATIPSNVKKSIDNRKTRPSQKQIDRRKLNQTRLEGQSWYTEFEPQTNRRGRKGMLCRIGPRSEVD